MITSGLGKIVDDDGDDNDDNDDGGGWRIVPIVPLGSCLCALLG